MIALEEQMLDEIPAYLSNVEVLSFIDQGNINSRYLLILQHLTSISDEIVSSWLNINLKTYRTYKKSEVALKEDVQEHTLFLLALMKHGIDIFGDKENFSRWLDTENFFFDKRKPMAFLNTISGIKFIHDRLTGIEYGDNA
jgi:putative toxin-antitoxin system antitoxin component (TIGR02293 family)